MGATVVSHMGPADLSYTWPRIKGQTALHNLQRFLHWPATVRAIESDTVKMLVPDRLPPEFLPSLTGQRVTAYPWEIASIRANNLQWQPLPVMQAYAAFTPSLDRSNARALESSTGPDNVLFQWTSIDGRYPFYETPLSWQALLNWYDVSMTSPEACILQRRATPRFEIAAPSGDTVTHWGETVMLPGVADNEILTMEATVPESPLGLFTHTLFRASPIMVRAVRQSNIASYGRVVRANLGDGVVVSDCPLKRADLLPMLTPGPAPFRDRVVSISFETAGPSEYGSDIRIRWFRRLLRQ
jgi:hypothetical protein